MELRERVPRSSSFAETGTGRRRVFRRTGEHCAIAIQALAVLPVTFREVSAMFRVWATTWQNSTAVPSIRLSELACGHSHFAPDGAVRRTFG